MPARTLRIKHSDEVRAKIQASQLINRLNDHVNGKVTLSSTQVRAAEILLRKSVPDLSRVEVTGDPLQPVHTVNRIELVPLDGNGTDSSST
jgi:hypothetical protein